MNTTGAVNMLTAYENDTFYALPTINNGFSRRDVARHGLGGA